jgi:hypothetical protein
MRNPGDMSAFKRCDEVQDLTESHFQQLIIKTSFKTFSVYSAQWALLI